MLLTLVVTGKYYRLQIAKKINGVSGNVSEGQKWNPRVRNPDLKSALPGHNLNN